MVAGGKFASLRICGGLRFCVGVVGRVPELFLCSSTKDHLMQIADHYGINVADKKNEGEIRDVLSALSAD